MFFENLSDKGDILLCGDFNARTAMDLDFINDDNDRFIPIYQNYNSDKTMLQRQGKDKTIDAWSRTRFIRSLHW